MPAALAILTFETVEVEGEGGPYKVLLARPAEPIRLDLTRLEQLRRGDFASKIDSAIVAGFDAQLSRPDMVVFDARNPEGEPFWGFGPELDDEQRMEFGRELLRSQIAMYRHLVEAGSVGIAGVGLGSFELAAFQRGTVRIVTDLTAEHEDAVSTRAIDLEIELWLIEHAASWTGLTVSEYLSTKAAGEVARRRALGEEIDKLLDRAKKLAEE